MIDKLIPHLAGNLFFQRLESGMARFGDLTRFNINQMPMMRSCFFTAGGTITKFETVNKTGFFQQFDLTISRFN